MAKHFVRVVVFCRNQEHLTLSRWTSAASDSLLSARVNQAAFDVSPSFIYSPLRPLLWNVSISNETHGEGVENKWDCIYTTAAASLVLASIGCCQSLSRFYVKLPIHAVSIDQMTKCLFIFFLNPISFLRDFLAARLYRWVSARHRTGNCASVCLLLCGESCYLSLYGNKNRIDSGMRLIG